MIDNSLVPANEIWYTTIDDEPIKLIGRINKKIVSNTYKEGKGVIVFKEPVVEIRERDFGSCKSLREIAIPSSVTEIGKGAFEGCEMLNSITFQGTIAQWNEIELGNLWNHEVSATVVHCTDGDVEI